MAFLAAAAEAGAVFDVGFMPSVFFCVAAARSEGSGVAVVAAWEAVVSGVGEISSGKVMLHR